MQSTFMERGGKESDFKSGGTKEGWNENTKEKEMFKTEIKRYHT